MFRTLVETVKPKKLIGLIITYLNSAMSAPLISQLFASLYSLVKEEAKFKRKNTRTRAGHLFEDVR